MVIFGVIKLSVTFLHIPGVIHYNSSRALISRFNDYICTLPECYESFAFSRRKFVANRPTIVGLQDMMSFSTALMKASRAASLPLGGAHVPSHLKRFTSSDGLVELVWLFWKDSFSRERLAKSFISACISDQLRANVAKA